MQADKLARWAVAAMVALILIGPPGASASHKPVAPEWMHVLTSAPLPG
jgi:hypothetical protein